MQSEPTSPHGCPRHCGDLAGSLRLHVRHWRREVVASVFPGVFRWGGRRGDFQGARYLVINGLESTLKYQMVKT